jgi:hypothetical protein
MLKEKLVWNRLILQAYYAVVSFPSTDGQGVESRKEL